MPEEKLESRAAPYLFWFLLSLQLLFFAALNLFDDWTLEYMPVKFVGAALISGFAYLAAVSRFAVIKARSAQIVVFWSVALALRLIAFPLAAGDDLWRYQWEGKVQHAGFNPYVTAPDDERLLELREDFPEWHKINHRHFRTIYPPGAQMLFAAFTGISDHPIFYKLIFTLADLATVLVLLRLLRLEGRAFATRHVSTVGMPSSQELAPPLYLAAAWYAWNPLVVYSFTGAAHFDSLMLLPMVASILFVARSESETNPRRKWLLAVAASCVLGIAISIKLIPVLLILLFAFALRKRAIVLLMALMIPLLLSLAYGFPQIKIWQSLSDFAYVTRLNDLFWWLIEDTVWPNPRQKNYRYNVIVLVCVALISFAFIRNWKRGTVWVFGASLILTPALHAWYCTWILPVATWRRTYAWHVLSVTIFAYYLFWNERLFALPWRSEPWLRGIIILPPLMMLLGSWMRRGSSQRSGE